MIRRLLLFAVAQICLGLLLTAGWYFPGVLHWLLPVVGSAALLASGLNLVLVVEQLSRITVGIGQGIGLASTTSLIVTPAAIEALSHVVHGQPALLNAANLFLIYWAGSVGLLLVLGILLRQPSTIEQISSRMPWREGLLLLALLCTIMAVHFFLYRYIPEADGYGYLITLRNLQLHPANIALEPRPYFVLLLALFAQLSKVDPYWVLKVVLPLWNVVSVLILYLIARPFCRTVWQRMGVVLIYLSVPVVAAEALIARPQSILTITVLPIAYALGRITIEHQSLRSLYWTGMVVVLGVLGLRIHPLFAIVFLLGICASGLVIRNTFRRYPVDTVVLVAGLLGIALIHPTIRTYAVQVQAALFPIYRSLSLHLPKIWFLDHYRNIDGNEVGWPGWTALLYYAYNLGMLLPVAILFAVSNRGRVLHAFRQPEYWPFWLLGIGFFVVAEVLPRFQLALLPDRAWLFADLSALCLLPPLWAALRPQRWQRLVLVASAAVSVCMGYYVTFAKQGWVSTNEKQALTTIEATEPNALFLGQGSLRILVNYFGRRDFVSPSRDVFLSNDPIAVQAFLIELDNKRELAADALRNEQETLIAGYENIADRVRAQPVDQPIDLQGFQKNLLGQAQLVSDKAARFDAQYPTTNRPVYIIYDRTIFESLYGKRSWWREMNYYQADLQKLSDAFAVVYDHGGLTIWKVR